MSNAIAYRRATRDELNLAVEWAAGEGWNPGLHDADLFWDTDPDGFVCAERNGEPLFLDVPEPNEAALALAARHGMREVFGCARLYHGPAPTLPLQQTYGITTFELG